MSTLWSVTHWGGQTWLTLILGHAVVLKLVGLRGPKCVKKTSPTLLRHQHRADPLIRDRVDTFTLFMLNSDLVSKYCSRNCLDRSAESLPCDWQIRYVFMWLNAHCFDFLHAV